MNISPQQYALILKALLLLLEIAKFYNNLSSTFRSTKRKQHLADVNDLQVQLRSELESVENELKSD